MRSKILFSAALAAPLAMAWGETKYEVHGRAWLDFGRIVHAEDTLTNILNPDVHLNYNKNGHSSVGAQVTVLADLTDNLEAGFGFGAYKAAHASGNGQNTWLVISLYQNFLTQSRLTWYSGEKAAPDYSLSIGSFPYNYNPDVKNLGLYLLRGTVYPGVIMGGFGDFGADSTKANVLGARFHHAIGGFSHDLILNSERDVPPTFDWSLAYLAKYKLGALEIGGGVNFYRLLPYNSDLMTPGKDTALVGAGSGRKRFIEIDTTIPGKPDTTFFTHQGTKLVGTASLDIKRLLGMESGIGLGQLHPDDMKIYAEGAVIGWANYGKMYGKRSERIPVMFGINIPTWGILSHLSLEVEHYGSKYRNDLGRVGNNNIVADWTRQDHPIPSPKAPTNEDYQIGPDGYYRNKNDPSDSVFVRGTAMDKENVTKDNLKWSLYMDKVVAGHIQFVAQVANDHYRPRPLASNVIVSEGGTAEMFASPKDWYWMLRVGYFF